MSRTIPAGVLTEAAAGATTLARCWKVTRADAAVYRWTEHDRPLTVDGETYAPAYGLQASDADTTLDLAANTFTGAGALDAAALTEADMLAGKWDGATVVAIWADWSDPTRFWVDFTGTTGETRRGETGFEMEFRAGAAALTTRGRTHARTCDARFGDTRCGLDVTTSTYRATATVTVVRTPTLLFVSGLSSYATRWFEAGEAVWLTGANTGQLHEVRLFVTGTDAKLQFWDAPRQTVGIGDTVQVTAGCDKRFATCKGFSNAVNFRGFPHMPGDAAVIRGLDDTEPRDGSGRNVGRD